MLHEALVLRLRAQVARALGDDAGWGEFLQRYRVKAAAAGFGPLVEVVDTTE